MELYPSWLRKLWKEWDLRLMVLLSLIFQILLNFLGNRRKYSNKLWIRIVVWSAYITADSVATFALGILSSNLIELYDKDHDVAGSSSSLLDANTQLSAFWAPFLVLHLGGPDTITAYALADNELWSRNLLGLVVQTGMAISIFVMSWTASSLSILSLVMFLPGIIKYGERVWVLRSTTSQKRGQSYGFGYSYNHNLIKSEKDILFFAKDNQFIISHAFSDDTMVQSVRKYTFDTFRIMLPEDAFKVIEIELGLMYDLLYTKAPLLYTRRGLVMRLITFFLTCLVMVLFPVLVDKHKYSKVYLSITYLLIIVAVIHDIYAALLMVFSDTFAAWLIKNNRDSILKTFNCFPLLKKQPSTSTGLALAQDQHQPNTSTRTSTMRWSNKMSQHSLLRFTSSKAKPWMSFKLLNKIIEMGKYWHCEVSEELRKLIFEYVKRKAEDAEESKQQAEDAEKSKQKAEKSKQKAEDAEKSKQKAEDAETSRGTDQWRPPFAELPSPRSIVQQMILIIKRKYNINQGRSINEEFEFSIIAWHIATEVWYYSDRDNFMKTDYRLKCKMIKRVSRYMMYLLVERPSMLSAEDSTDRISYRGIRKIADYKERIKLTSRDKAEECNRLVEKYTHCTPFMQREEEELIYLAMELVRKVNDESHSQVSIQALKSKWKRIESAWMDILGYAARKCKGNEHAQQLRRGGELLTHVWLLLCHFGLTDHYEIERYDEIESDEEK